MSGRPETGPMKFGGDWQGVFIRGDNAAYFRMAIEQALEGEEFNRFAMQGALDALSGKREDTQRLRPFSECKEGGEGDEGSAYERGRQAGIREARERISRVLFGGGCD